jgi:hypothetical protein
MVEKKQPEKELGKKEANKKIKTYPEAVGITLRP